MRGVWPRGECCSLFLFVFLSKSLREVSALAASAIVTFGGGGGGGGGGSERPARVTNLREPAGLAVT